MKSVIPINREQNEPPLTVRGGAWSNNPYFMQAAYRYYYHPFFPTLRSPVRGFRIVRKK